MYIMFYVHCTYILRYIAVLQYSQVVQMVRCIYNMLYI